MFKFFLLIKVFIYVSVNWEIWRNFLIAFAQIPVEVFKHFPVDRWKLSLFSNIGWWMIDWWWGGCGGLQVVLRLKCRVGVTIKYVVLLWLNYRLIAFGKDKSLKLLILWGDFLLNVHANDWVLVNSIAGHQASCYRRVWLHSLLEN